MASQSTPRNVLIQQLALLLGDQMIDVELDRAHYDQAIDMALERVRQRSDGALLEQDLILHVTAEVSEYTLPQEVQEVRRLYRRGVGPYSNGGATFDPVDAALFSNQLLTPNMPGGLATWAMYSSYLETAELLFASQYNFTWDTNSKKLTIIRKVRGDEDVVVRVYSRKSEDDMLRDPYVGPWVRSYASAVSKLMLGQARDKFSGGLPGPNGTVTLNGSALKQEAAAEMERLDKELDTQVTAGDGYGFIIG